MTTNNGTPPEMPRSPLFDPTSGRFNVRRLQRELFVRGWATVAEFALGLKCGRTSVYKAFAGQAVRNRVGRAILDGLQRREPRPSLLE